MIYLAPDVRQKMEVLDKIIEYTPIDDFVKTFEADLVAIKLRENPLIGSLPQRQGPYCLMIYHYEQLENRVNFLEQQNMNLQNDIKTLIRVVGNTLGGPMVQNDIQSLRSKHSVY